MILAPMNSLNHHAKTAKSKMMAVGPEAKSPTKLSNLPSSRRKRLRIPLSISLSDTLESQVTARSGSVNVVKANASDLNLIIEILVEAGAWLRSKGIDSPWQMPGYFS